MQTTTEASDLEYIRQKLILAKKARRRKKMLVVPWRIVARKRKERYEAGQCTSEIAGKSLYIAEDELRRAKDELLASKRRLEIVSAQFHWHPDIFLVSEAGRVAAAAFGS